MSLVSGNRLALAEIMFVYMEYPNHYELRDNDAESSKKHHGPDRFALLQTFVVTLQGMAQVFRSGRGDNTT